MSGCRGVPPVPEKGIDGVRDGMGDQVPIPLSLTSVSTVGVVPDPSLRRDM